MVITNKHRLIQNQLKTPRLIVIIDTEEEFDWSNKFSRENTSVKALQFMHHGQTIFDEYNIRPTYAIDYPVASKPEGFEIIKEIYDDSRCEIAAHLHPWVNPPYTERVNRYNSFPCNLPDSLEKRKLDILGQTIKQNLGAQPCMYKAGRYGVGANSAAVLRGLGYQVDVSICPYMNYSAEGGPDFRHLTPFPFWLNEQCDLLEIPLTIGFSGCCRKNGSTIHEFVSRPPFKHLHPVGILARSNIVNKIRLTPEGHPASELIALTKSLIKDGLKIFSLAFHSPSLQPGNTPYVQTHKDLQNFLTCLNTYFDFFFNHLNGEAETPLGIKHLLTHTSE